MKSDMPNLLTQSLQIVLHLTKVPIFCAVASALEEQNIRQFPSRHMLGMEVGHPGGGGARGGSTRDSRRRSEGRMSGAQPQQVARHSVSVKVIDWLPLTDGQQLAAQI
jgi:hypothetical protein